MRHIALRKRQLRIATNSDISITGVLLLVNAIFLIGEGLEVNLDLGFLRPPSFCDDSSCVMLAVLGKGRRQRKPTDAGSSQTGVASMNPGGHPLTVDDELIPRPTNAEFGNLRVVRSLKSDSRLKSRS